MARGSAVRPLAELPVLLFDAQATAANPALGALLELGWARGTAAEPIAAAAVEACVVAPPPGTALPRPRRRPAARDPQGRRR